MSDQSLEAQSKFSAKAIEEGNRLTIFLKGLKALNASLDDDYCSVLAGKLPNATKTYMSHERTTDTFIRCIELYFDKKLTALGDIIDDVFEKTQSDEEFIVADDDVEASDYEPSESEDDEDSDFILTEEEDTE